MRCESFEARLNEVLDARQSISSADDISEHIRHCGRCRELAMAYESVLVGLRDAEVPCESAGMTARILTQLRPPRVIGFPGRRTVLAMAAAAAILAAVGLPWMLNRQGARPAKDQGTPIVVKANQPDGGGQTEPQRIERQLASQENESASASQTRSAMAFLDPHQLQADNLMSSLPGSEWAHNVADGLKPVTKPTVGAISGFLQLWGVGEEGHRS